MKMTEWKPETAEMTKLFFDLSNFENLPEWFKEELSKMVISDLYGIAEKNVRE